MEYAKYPVSMQLGSELDKKKILPVYLFLGEEDGDKEKYIRRIVDMIFPDRDTAVNYTGRFHIEMDEFMKAADFALSGSMFSECKVCVMHNIDSLNATPANLGIFREIINSLTGPVRLIMTTAENRVPKFIGKDMTGRIGIYHFWKPFEKDLVPYIISTLKKNGTDIDADAAAYLVGTLGRNVQMIDEAIEKLRNFSGKGTVTREIAGSVINEERDITLFEFIDALYKKRKRSLDLLKKLVENNYAGLLILNQLIRQAEQLEKYYDQVQGGRSTPEAMEAAGVPAKYKNDFFEYLNKYNREGVQGLYARFHEADYALKSYRASRSILSHPLFDLATGMLFMD